MSLLKHSAVHVQLLPIPGQAGLQLLDLPPECALFLEVLDQLLVRFGQLRSEEVAWCAVLLLQVGVDKLFLVGQPRWRLGLARLRVPLGATCLVCVVAGGPLRGSLDGERPWSVGWSGAVLTFLLFLCLHELFDLFLVQPFVLRLLAVQLRGQALNLALQLADDVPVLLDCVLALLNLRFVYLSLSAHRFVVHLLVERVPDAGLHIVAVHRVLDLLGSLGILERVHGLFVRGVELADAREHHRLGVATQRVLEQTRQLAVSVAYEPAWIHLLLAERVDAVA